MTNEVSAAANLPQITPLYWGMRDTTRGSYGVYRRHRAAGRCSHLKPSLPDQMTQETGMRPNGAAAAIRAVRPPRTRRHDYYKFISRLGAAAADTSYVIIRASFSPIHHSTKRFLGSWRPKSLALARQ